MIHTQHTYIIHPSHRRLERLPRKHTPPTFVPEMQQSPRVSRKRQQPGSSDGADAPSTIETLTRDICYIMIGARKTALKKELEDNRKSDKNRLHFVMRRLFLALIDDGHKEDLAAFVPEGDETLKSRVRDAVRANYAALLVSVKKAHASSFRRWAKAYTTSKADGTLGRKNRGLNKEKDGKGESTKKSFAQFVDEDVQDASALKKECEMFVDGISDVHVSRANAEGGVASNPDMYRMIVHYLDTHKPKQSGKSKSKSTTMYPVQETFHNSSLDPASAMATCCATLVAERMTECIWGAVSADEEFRKALADRAHRMSFAHGATTAILDISLSGARPAVDAAMWGRMCICMGEEPGVLSSFVDGYSRFARLTADLAQHVDLTRLPRLRAQDIAVAFSVLLACKLGVDAEEKDAPEEEDAGADEEASDGVEDI